MSDTRIRDDDDEVVAGRKLIPEWSVNADDQIVAIGVAVFVALAAVFGFSRLGPGGGDEQVAAVAPVTASSSVEAVGPGDGADGEVGLAAGPGAPASTTAVPTTAVPTTAVPTTAAVVGPDLVAIQAAVDQLPGLVVIGADGTTVTLEGFVADAEESATAEQAAAGVVGVTSVDNRLVLLEPRVLEVLGGAGVAGAAVVGEGTGMVVSGALPAEAQRLPVLEAVRAVEGVTSVVDELTVSVSAALNELPQVQFRTGSAEILPGSLADLDRAATLINGAGDVRLRIEGYTDVTGGTEANLQLSQDRANAVRDHLVSMGGVDAARLEAEGFGETTDFAPGDDPASLAANRVVRFTQL